MSGPGKEGRRFAEEGDRDTGSARDFEPDSEASDQQAAGRLSRSLIHARFGGGGRSRGGRGRARPAEPRSRAQQPRRVAGLAEHEFVDEKVVSNQEVGFHRSRRDLECLNDEGGCKKSDYGRNDNGFKKIPCL